MIPRLPPGGPAPPERQASARGLLLDLAVAAGLLGLLFLVSTTAPRWSRFLRQPLPSAPDEGELEEGTPTPTPPVGDVQRTINVKLFFEAQDGSGLVIEERTVPFSGDLARQIETVVGALVTGSESGLLPPLPPDTRVLGAFVSSDGVAYVNLSKEALVGLPGGSRSELLSVYSLVDSIAANFPAVSRVQILVDDRPADTLGGHIDLSRPLPPDMSLLAALAVTPVEAPRPGEPPRAGSAGDPAPAPPTAPRAPGGSP